MRQLVRVIILGFLIAQLGILIDSKPALADGDHSHPEEKMEMNMGMGMDMDMKMDMHEHTPAKKHEPDLPPGTKEVKIDLSGPFCHKHPDEIREALMKLPGVVHIEAFSGRKYILVHYNGDKAAPTEMEKVVDGLKGSGWRCEGTLSKKKSTER